MFFPYELNCVFFANLSVPRPYGGNGKTDHYAYKSFFREKQFVLELLAMIDLWVLMEVNLSVFIWLGKS